MRLILQTANVSGDPKNCLYPNKVEVMDAAGMKEAVKLDHVCAEYKKNYRNIDNFICTNVIIVDCDNDHSGEGGRADGRLFLFNSIQPPPHEGQTGQGSETEVSYLF